MQSLHCFAVVASFLLEFGVLALDVTASASGHETTYNGTTRYVQAPPFPNTSLTSSPTTFPSTGSGFDFATDCESRIRSQSSAILDYQSQHGSSVVTTISNTMTWTRTPWAQSSPTKVVTLCDGHERVVGSLATSMGEPEVLTTSWYNTNTNFELATTYMESPPCSIGYGDCMSLWSTWTSKSNSVVNTVSAYYLPEEPPCNNPATSDNYTFSTNPTGGLCDNCLIMASTARLLYWPITTATGSYDLCDNRAPTIPATSTGVGPNTFVTGDLTITSPTIAISFALVSRADQCGPTVTGTVIPVHPDEVSSVRGYRVFYTHLPFNFADLNMECIGNSTDPDNCFTAVPADAYFGGLNRDAALEGEYEGLTVFNDYKPQILMPKTMESGIFDTWGNHCVIHPDGVWDPPVAMQRVETIVLPTVPGGVSAEPTPTSTAEADTPPTTAASPAKSQDNGQGLPTGKPSEETNGNPPIAPATPTRSNDAPELTSLSAVQLHLDVLGNRVYRLRAGTLTQIEAADDEMVLVHNQEPFTLTHGSVVTWQGQILSADSNDVLMVASAGSNGGSSNGVPLSAVDDSLPESSDGSSGLESGGSGNSESGNSGSGDGGSGYGDAGDSNSGNGNPGNGGTGNGESQNGGSENGGSENSGSGNGDSRDYISGDENAEWRTHEPQSFVTAGTRTLAFYAKTSDGYVYTGDGSTLVVSSEGWVDPYDPGTASGVKAQSTDAAGNAYDGGDDADTSLGSGADGASPDPNQPSDLQDTADGQFHSSATTTDGFGNTVTAAAGASEFLGSGATGTMATDEGGNSVTRTAGSGAESSDEAPSPASNTSAAGPTVVLAEFTFIALAISIVFAALRP